MYKIQEGLKWPKDLELIDFGASPYDDNNNVFSSSGLKFVKDILA